MLVFKEGGKPENPEKNPRRKSRTNKNSPNRATGCNRIQPCERSHHCAIPALRYVGLNDKELEDKKLGLKCFYYI